MSSINGVITRLKIVIFDSGYATIILLFIQKYGGGYLMLYKHKRLFYGYVLVMLSAVLLSVIAVMLVTSSLNTKVFDLLHSDSVSVSISGNESPNKILITDDDYYAVTCNANWSDVYLCGISFNLPYDSEQPISTSFNKSDRIELKASATSTNHLFDQRLRVTVRSEYDDSIQGAKYQSIRLTSGEEQSALLGDFKVDTWWLDQNKVPYKGANLDFTKVLNVELLANDIPIIHEGDYLVQVSELKIISKYITLYELLIFMCVFWPLLIMAVLCHVAFHFRQASVAVTKQLYLDKNTGFNSTNALLENYETWVSAGFTPSSVYLFKVDNYYQLIQKLGEKNVSILLTKEWARFRKKYKAKNPVIYRVDHNEFVIKLLSEKLSDEEIATTFKLSEDGTQIDNMGLFVIDLKIAYIPSVFLPDTLEEMLNYMRKLLAKSKTSNEKYFEFTETEFLELDHESQVEVAIKETLSSNNFYLQFMPFYDSNTGKIIGAEALLRCKSKALKGMSPEVYIRVAENSGLIKQIDYWVLSNAFEMLTSYTDDLGDFMLSINISARNMIDKSFIKGVGELVQKYKVDTSKVCLEITETFFVYLTDNETDNINDLRKLGFVISLDDFGTGYTSYQTLMTIPADEIKIDRDYVNRLGEPQVDAVVRSIVSIAKAFDYKLVAEGVETKKQLDTLIAIGCDTFQGYYISKPTDFAGLITLKNEGIQKVS